MAQLGLATVKPQKEQDGNNKNVVENTLEENFKLSGKIEKISIEDGKRENDGHQENNKQKNSNEIVSDENHGKESKFGKTNAQENITLTTNIESMECPTIPVAAGLIHEYKPHWQISNHDLKKIVAIPEYLAEAMADAVSSKGANTIVVPPQDANICAPRCPILVFINSRSGGQLGPDLLIHLSDLISPLQVYDLARTVPETLFRFGLGCLDKLSLAGDGIAQATRNNLRIMVAGGDGTVGWVLTCIRSFQETLLTSGHKIPPVGIIPLGTGNDLARSFGWGGHFPFATRHNVKKWLVKAIYATTAPLDSWQVLLKPSPSLPKLHLRLPYCLEECEDLPMVLYVCVFKHAKWRFTLWSKTSTDSKPNMIYGGIFRNYFSVGMDAQVAFGFHNFRNHMPWIARGRLANQMIYGGFSCTQGWFCTACSCKKRRGVKNDVRLFVKRQASVKEWEFIYIPSNIRAIVILNLQSYAGGRNPWGHPREGKKKDYVEAAPNDGLLEIVGLRDGWHAAFIMISALTAIRLCQAAIVRLEMSGNRTAAYMQMDGEPWQQPLANAQESPTILELSLSTPSSLMLQGWRKVHKQSEGRKEKNHKKDKK